MAQLNPERVSFKVSRKNDVMAAEVAAKATAATAESTALNENEITDRFIMPPLEESLEECGASGGAVEENGARMSANVEEGAAGSGAAEKGAGGGDIVLADREAAANHSFEKVRSTLHVFVYMIVYMYAAIASVRTSKLVDKHRLSNFEHVKIQAFSHPALYTARRVGGGSVSSGGADGAAVGSTGAQPPQGPVLFSTYQIVGEDAHEVCLTHLPEEHARACSICAQGSYGGLDSRSIELGQHLLLYGIIFPGFSGIVFTVYPVNGVPTLIVIKATNWCSLEGVCFVEQPKAISNYRVWEAINP